MAPLVDMLNTLSVFALLDNGKVRDQNEDNYYRSDLDPAVDPATGQLFFAVDGVGGNLGGAEASFIACQLLPKHFFDPVRRTMPLMERLAEAIDLTHDEIVAAGLINSLHREMSCTLVALATADRESAIAWLGDSRIYRMRKDRLKQLTIDHSMVQEQVDLGILTEAQAAKHPNRNVVTRTLGGLERNIPDIRPLALQDGDRIILCTDGLHGPVSDGMLADLLKQAKSIEQIVQEAVQLANQNGGPDNIAAIGIQHGNFANVTQSNNSVAQYGQPIGLQYTPPPPRRRWRIWPWR